MGFRLVPKLVTLNDLEQRNGHYFAYFAEFVANYVKSGWLAINRFSPQNVINYQLSTTDALCSSQ